MNRPFRFLVIDVTCLMGKLMYFLTPLRTAMACLTTLTIINSVNDHK